MKGNENPETKPILNPVSQTLMNMHGFQILRKQNPVEISQQQVAKFQREKHNYIYQQYQRKVNIKGQGEYEITVKRLFNPVTMKSLTPGSTFMNQDTIRQIQNQQEDAEQRKLESAKKVQKIKENRERMLKYQMLPKVLRKIALKKIS